MNLQPEQIENAGYTLLDRLNHQELVPFVQLYIRKRTRFSILYYTANLVALGFSVFWFVWNYQLGSVKTGEGFSYFSYGILIAFLLIPIHEYIHVLAYRWQGATQTYYNANLKKFYFMALADRFVANEREFQIVALAPFVVISALSISLAFLTGTLGTFTVLGTLVTHTAFSSGDFALLSYFDFHKNKDVITYDDKATGLSFFYGKPKS
jgi:hypothetical protein